MPMLRTVVSYGVIGTKSALMTVRVWLSIENLNMVSIALLTVSFQAIRAATANPVKSLRSE